MRNEPESMRLIVWHFGGNGHCGARLARARAALGRRADAPGLLDVPYPGFEGRPAPSDLNDFLDLVAATCRRLEAEGGTPTAAYGSGIGALVLLGLRSRGDLVDLPLIFQGPVLWGLGERRFPRLLRRLPPARALLRRAFAAPWFQDHFAGKYFRKPLDGPDRAEFFEGYARCAAFGAFFDWFTPEWLDALRRQFARRPEGTRGVTVWLGEADRVVGRREVELTRAALGVDWPVVTFPGWGHYPMIDEPEEWADALRDALAPSGTVPGPGRPQAR